MDETTPDHGVQPLDGLMLGWGLSNHELVAGASEQINHKQVQKARKGRRLTLHLMRKLTRALNDTLLAELSTERREVFVPYLHKHCHSNFLQVNLRGLRKDRDGWATESSLLRAARKKAGLTQLQLAKRVGVTKGTLFTWEANCHHPSDNMVRKLSELLGPGLVAAHDQRRKA